MTLPPLPLEEAIWDDPEHGMVPVGYTADQMREYGKQCREAALEEAAQLLSTPEASRAPVLHHYANAIRKLKELK